MSPNHWKSQRTPFSIRSPTTWASTALAEWLTKFGYGQYTGIDLAEERSGNMPTREWKLKRFKKPWYQGDTIPVGMAGLLTANASTNEQSNDDAD